MAGNEPPPRGSCTISGFKPAHDHTGKYITPTINQPLDMNRRQDDSDEDVFKRASVATRGNK
jgi:hypothetical protein